ncbi:MAG: glycosyltransferase family 2 protein [Rhizomicrobium sp.]
MLDKITPVLLTFNEAANIERTLSRLNWAARIVVVDSFSTDDTLAILKRFSNVSLYQRAFDSHAEQWRFATGETDIATPWILRLDADYLLGSALIAELQSLDDDSSIVAYRIGFRYAVFSRLLPQSLYPPNTILLRQGRFQVISRGHTEAWIVEGREKNLRSKVIHDDRKSLARWVSSQLRYMELERQTLDRSWSIKTWLRTHPPLMPICVFLYCLLGRGLIFQGRAGIYYALQRTVAEAMLSLLLLDHRLRE